MSIFMGFNNSLLFPGQGQWEMRSNTISFPKYQTEHFENWLCNVCSFSLSKLKENLNINEAANFLVKHIIASENDILKSVVPDTISPQLNSDKEMTCSACFKPWEEVVTMYGSSIGL